MNERTSSTSGTTRTLILAAVLAVLAAVPRLVNLDRLSLYADEDLSALVAHSVATGGGGHLPSGFEYRRARPLTELMAVSERMFGTSEWVYRLPSALFGALTIPALFLFGRRLVGSGPALLAALLLAVSEWHIGFSRQARMYAPLVLAVVLGTWALWSWCRSGRAAALLAGSAATLFAAFLHKGGVMLGAILLVWLAIPGALAVPALGVLGAGVGLAVAGYAVSQFWTLAPYARLVATGAGGAAREAGAAVPGGPASPLTPTPVGLAAVVVGLALGAWLARHLVREGDEGPWRAVVLGTLSLLVGAMAGLGQVYGLGLAATLLLVADGRGLVDAGRRAASPGVALLVLCAGVALWGVAGAGLRPGLERAASVPYAHLFTLVQQAPTFFLLFIGACAAVAVAPRASAGLSACVLAAVGLLFGFGLLFEEVPTRYLLPIYPFALLAVAGVAGRATAALLRRTGTGGPRPAFAAALALCGVALSGLIGGHGLPQALRVAALEHGDSMNRIAHMFPFRPDSRTAGVWVREHRGPEDLVIAEDPIVQAWYAGRVDYWFRRDGDMRRFLEVRPDGSVRDIYVGSRPLPDPAVADSIAGAASGRVWLITSGETASDPEFYRSPAQRAWLDSLARARDPVVLGEDGVTAAFCLNCPRGGSPETPGTGPPDGSGTP